MNRAGFALLALIAATSPALADGHHHHHSSKPAPVPAPTPAPPAPPPAPDEKPPPPPPPDDSASPWAKGVTDEQKQTAGNLLAEGNDLFVQNKYREALAKYADAIAVWDHPAIRFNMVRALIALERPLEAYENLEKALAYGKAPLEDQVYTEALNYQTLLEGQIANIDVSCKQAGVTITVDGEKFLDCPGAKSERILPGHHEVVGQKAGFLTETQDAVLLPGVKAPIDVSLRSLTEAAVTRTRWKTWKPWAVAGGGALLAGIGVLVDLKASSDLDAFYTAVDTTCAGDGCGPHELDHTLLPEEHSALLENKIAIGMMAVGGAAVATGVVLVIMNRPHTYVPEQPLVTPMVTSTSAGAQLLVHY